MASQNLINLLSAELLDIVLSDLSIPDRISLSKASRYLHDKVTPAIYASWEYRRDNHTLKSLYCFLRTLILNPELAQCVKTLKICGWGNYDRFSGMSYSTCFLSPAGCELWGLKNGPKRHKGIKAMKACVRAKQKSSAWSDDFEILKPAVADLNLDEKTHSQYYLGISGVGRSESVLLNLLVSRLPSLQTLYLNIPPKWDMVRDFYRRCAKENVSYCRSLHTVYLCEVSTEVQRYGREFLHFPKSIEPFWFIPSVRSIRTLQCQISPPSILGDLDSIPARSLAISELVFDECALKLNELLKAITLPKTLRRFRWGEIPERPGFATPPVQPLRYPAALINALALHKDTLESLDLRALNPKEVGSFGFTGERLGLVGSLKHFSVLKSLTLTPPFLCGDSISGFSPHRLSDILPASLQTFCLHIDICRSVGVQFVVRNCMERLLELVYEAKTTLPALDNIMFFVTSDWRPSPDDRESFGPLEGACRGANIRFEARKGTMFGLTPEPWFQVAHKARP